MRLPWAHAQIPFTLFYFVFPATMIFSGMLLDRFGPRFSAILGGIIFGGGWLLSSLGGSQFIYTIVGNGVVAGVGAGIAYIVPIATCMKWYPNRKGLVTGIAVAGFGGGAAMISSVAGFLLDRQLTPFDLFGFSGCLFTLTILVAAIFMVNPRDYSQSSGIPLRSVHVWRDRRFLVLYFSMFTGLAAGLTVNANLKELYPSATLITGASAVSFFALSNATGRILWGGLLDRLGGMHILKINLLLQASLLFFSPFILVSGGGMKLFAILTGFNYGGVLVIYAGLVVRIWGPERVGSIYGWLFSANIPGGIAPLLAGYYYDKTGSFIPFLYCVAAVLLIAVVVLQSQRDLIRLP